MENIRRNIKLFFTRYGNHIFVIVAIILGVLLFLKLIDKIAEDNYRSKKLKMEKIQTSQKVESNIETKKIETQRRKKISRDKKTIDSFLSACKEKPEEAYEMLTTNCKIDQYPTLEDFKNKYLDVIFSQSKDYKIEEQEQDGVYKILFYVEDILQAGTVENRKRIENFYYIEEISSSERKLYINYNN